MARANMLPPVPMNPGDALKNHPQVAPQPMVENLVIDHMPQLGGPGASRQRVSLMPKTGGVVGITYAIVPASKVKNAHDLGWRRPPRGAKPFTIRGPMGAVNCEVIQYGDPIPGISTNSCRPYLMVDNAVWEETGLDQNTGFAREAAPEPVTPQPSAPPQPQQPPQSVPDGLQPKIRPSA